MGSATLVIMLALMATALVPVVAAMVPPSAWPSGSIVSVAGRSLEVAR